MGEESSGNNTVEIVIALVVVVASFMYIYDALMRYSKLDVLLAVLVFGAALIYLFSNVWRK